jgi:hypothetical protein
MPADLSIDLHNVVLETGRGEFSAVVEIDNQPLSFYKQLYCNRTTLAKILYFILEIYPVNIIETRGYSKCHVTSNKAPHS